MADTNEIGKVLFEWEAKEFHRRSRSIWWVLAVLALAIVFIVYGAMLRNWTLIGLVAAGVFAIYAVDKTGPRRFRHVITDRGIRVGEQFYAYNALKSFWISDTSEGASLNLVTARRFDLVLTLQIDRGDVEKVRRSLEVYLPEEEGRGEDTLDKISRWLKL